MQWSPLFVVLAIAALGVMLLLGVLIGKDEGDLTVTEVPAETTTTTPTTTTEPTPTEGVVPTPESGSGSTGERNQGSGGVAPGGTD